MFKENRELLEKVINDRLNRALNDGEDSVAFEEAMKAIDKQLKLDDKEFELEKEKSRQQFELSKEEQKQNFELDKEERKQEFEIRRDEKRQDFELEKDRLNREFEAKENVKNRKFEEKKIKLESKKNRNERVVRVVEVAAMLAIPIITAGCNTKFAKMLCNFEKDYTFTTTAGRALGGLFKLK